MGGPVQIGLRSSDGKARGAESYTSGISAFFDNDRFIEEDIFHTREFLIDSGDKDLRLIIPNGYGLVFGDHVTKKIHSMQGYTPLMTVSETGLMLSLTGGVITGDTNTEQENYIEHRRFERLFDKGYIKRTVTYADGRYVTPDIPDTLSCNQIFASLIDAFRKKERSPSRVEYIIDSGFEIINYAETATGTTQFLKNLQDDGIRFSDEELNDWKEFIDDRYSWEEEEEYEDAGPYETSYYDPS